MALAKLRTQHSRRILLDSVICSSTIIKWANTDLIDLLHLLDLTIKSITQWLPTLPPLHRVQALLPSQTSRDHTLRRPRDLTDQLDPSLQADLISPSIKGPTSPRQLSQVAHWDQTDPVRQHHRASRGPISPRQVHLAGLQAPIDQVHQALLRTRGPTSRLPPRQADHRVLRDPTLWRSPATRGPI